MVLKYYNMDDLKYIKTKIKEKSENYINNQKVKPVENKTTLTKIKTFFNWFSK